MQKIWDKNRLFYWITSGCGLLLLLLEILAAHTIGMLVDDLVAGNQAVLWETAQRLLLLLLGGFVLGLTELRARRHFLSRLVIGMKENILLVMSMLEISEQHEETDAFYRYLLTSEMDALQENVWQPRLDQRIAEGGIALIFLFLAIFRLPLAFGLLCVTALTALFVYALSRFQARKLAGAEDTDNFTYLFAGLDSFKMLGLHQHFYERVKQEAEKQEKAKLSNALGSDLLEMVLRMLLVLAQLVGLFLCAYAAARGQLTPGGMIYTIWLFHRVFRLLRQVETAYHKQHQAAPLLEKIENFLHRSSLHKEDYTGGTQTISFRDLTIDREKEGEEPLFRRFNRNIRRGNAVAIIGPSGSGKSTLMQAMIGAIKPRSGLVTFDGHDVREYRQSTFLQKVRYIPSEPYLLPDTNEENILLGRSLAPDEWKQWYERFGFSASDLKKNLSEITLTETEKKRIGLLRALIDSPEILIFDEPFLHLDPEKAASLRANILRLPETKILLFHEESEAALDQYDQIIRLS